MSSRLEDALRDAGLRSELRVMASNGGVATPAMVEREAGDDALVGACRGRPRRRLGRRFERPPQAGHLRHRRHQRRHRHRRRGPICRNRSAQHLDRGLSAAVADDRHSHHRRRRRLDRLYRSRRRVPGRPAQRRRDAGAGRLWARRQRADRDRRQCRARPARQERFPRRQHEAR